MVKRIKSLTNPRKGKKKGFGRNKKEKETEIRSFFDTKKLRDPFLSTLTEVETPQVTPSKLPYGTRDGPLSAATFLS